MKKLNPSIFSQSVPQMPEGYYSGDKPNPNLRAFVEAHIKENPYDPETDDYNVPAFDKPIETTKATAIYNMHTYWSKKPHDAIRQYIKHYTKPGDLVLDPFCGSGGTALAALMEGRKAIAIDRSPAATFITKNYCTPVDVNELQKAFEELQAKVKHEIDWLYETRCDRCGGKATTAYTVYSQVFQCPRCLQKVPLFDCVEVEGKTAKGKPKKINVCPHCYARGIEEEIKTDSKKYGAIPVLVSYICEQGCKPARNTRRYNDSDENKRQYFNDFDLAKIKEIEQREIPYWYPKNCMMNVPKEQECWGVKWRAGTSNFRTVDELFTKRNLWALAAIREASINSPLVDELLFCLSGICLSMSKMYLWGPKDEHGIIKGTYYIPQISRSQNVYEAFVSKLFDLIKTKLQISYYLKGSIFISTQTTTLLNNIPSNSIDYIFTDPPYADKVQYGELNFIWEAWLGFDTRWHDEEIIVNEIRGKTEEDWANAMRSAMAECYRVLKPGRWLSLCYHDTSEGTWSLIQDIMAEVGFIVDKSDTALFIDTGQKSYNQQTADKVNKRDLVINFRKPKSGEIVAKVTITGNEDSRTFNEKVHSIIRDYLGANPGATKDRIYDEVVSHMVRAGKMEAHDFEGLLRQIAEEVISTDTPPIIPSLPSGGNRGGEVSRWYLKETEFVEIDTAESAKEDASASIVATFILKTIAKKYPSITLPPSSFNHYPHDVVFPDQPEGVHYSDIFEQYIYSVKDKPRRPLSEWLLDYFYKTDEGTYRLPQSEEEKILKAEGRAKGIHRRIKRFISYLMQGVAIPTVEQPNDATLLEWLRYCKRSGLYEQGKLLYEKGGLNLDNLSEKDMINAEEDYQICVRLLARGVKGKIK